MRGSSEARHMETLKRKHQSQLANLFRFCDGSTKALAKMDDSPEQSEKSKSKPFAQASDEKG
tara:strand:+ start:281 stop:466 length:186 start_codon:yes stop_codon:yes gene_type:complete